MESPAVPLTQADTAKVSLELSKPIERTIAGGEAHSYTVTLAAAQYAEIVVDQRGVDTVLTVVGSDGVTLFEVDSPHVTHGPERVAMLADSPATYRIEVESQTKSVGRYEIKLQELRTATQQDRKRSRAQRSLEIHFRVLELRRAAKDKNESITLSNIANCYRNLADHAKALDFYSQSLAMMRQGNSKYYLSAVLNNIGVVYRLLGLPIANRRQKLWRCLPIPFFPTTIHAF